MCNLISGIKTGCKSTAAISFLVASTIISTGCKDQSPGINGSSNNNSNTPTDTSTPAGNGNTGGSTTGPSVDSSSFNVIDPNILDGIQTNMHISADTIGIGDSVAAPTIATLVEMLTNAQSELLNMGDAQLLNETGNNPVEALTNTLENIGSDILLAATGLNSEFSQLFGGNVENPFSAIVNELIGNLSSIYSLNADASSFEIDSAVDLLNGSLDSLGLGIQTLELLQLGEIVNNAAAEAQDQASDILNLNAVGYSLVADRLEDLTTALQSGNLESALSVAQLALSGNVIEPLASALGLNISGLSDITDALGAYSSADLSDLESRQGVIRNLAELVDFINETLLGLLPQTLDPAFDPLVGLIVTSTNLLDNVAGTNSGDNTIVNAALGNLSADEIADAFGYTIYELNSDLFTRVFPLSQHSSLVPAELLNMLSSIDDISDIGFNDFLSSLEAITDELTDCGLPSTVDAYTQMGVSGCAI